MSTNMKAMRAYVDGMQKRIDELEAQNAALTTRLQEAEEVIKPFANEDFCVELSGNFQGDLSPVFQRVQAMLTLGDFRRAAAWLKGGTN